MAIISNDPSDYPPISPPHEPDAWYRVRPMTAGSLRQAAASGRSLGSIDMTFAALPWLIVDWSWSLPITPETVDDLDADTVLFLLTHAKEISKIRDPQEREVLVSGSSATMDPAAEPSLASSGIS